MHDYSDVTVSDVTVSHAIENNLHAAVYYSYIAIIGLASTRKYSLMHFVKFIYTRNCMYVYKPS